MSSLKETYDREGYVIVPGLIPNSELSALKEATDRVVRLTRSGKWPYRRTVGKQFPPFNAESPDSWGIQHVMHPELGEPEFVRWYTSDEVANTAKELLDCDEEDLQMGKLDLFL